MLAHEANNACTLELQPKSCATSVGDTATQLHCLQSVPTLVDGGEAAAEAAVEEEFDLGDILAEGVSESAADRAAAVEAELRREVTPWPSSVLILCTAWLHSVQLVMQAYLTSVLHA